MRSLYSFLLCGSHICIHEYSCLSYLRVTEWLGDWVIDWMTDMTYWRNDWRNDGMTYWLTGWLNIMYLEYGSKMFLAKVAEM